MAVFTGSSQQRHWLFSSVEALDRATAKQSDSVKCTKEQLELFRSVCAWRLLRLCQEHRLPRDVEATAAAYFHRYFLRHSFAPGDRHGYSLEEISLACILLACKTCEFRLDSHLSQVFARVHKVEPALLAGLRFQLQVHHPYLPLDGLLLQWKKFAPAKLASKIDAVAPSVEAAIRTTLLSDLCFRFSPAQLAVGALLQLMQTDSPADAALQKSLQDFVFERICSSQKAQVSSLMEVCKEMLKSCSTKKDQDLENFANNEKFQQFEKKLLNQGASRSTSRSSKKRQRTGDVIAQTDTSTH